MKLNILQEAAWCELYLSLKLQRNWPWLRFLHTLIHFQHTLLELGKTSKQTVATNCMALSSSLEIFFSLQSFIDWLQSSAANQKEATAHYLVRIFWALSCEAISLLFDPKATGNGYECPTCHGSWDSFFPRSIFNSLMNLHLLPVLKRTTKAYDSWIQNSCSEWTKKEKNKCSLRVSQSKRRCMVYQCTPTGPAVIT